MLSMGHLAILHNSPAAQQADAGMLWGAGSADGGVTALEKEGVPEPKPLPWVDALAAQQEADCKGPESLQKAEGAWVGAGQDYADPSFVNAA